HAFAHDLRRAGEVLRVAPQAPEPRAVVGLVAEGLAADEADQVVGDPAAELDEDVVLVERIAQPFQRLAALVAEELARQFLAGREPCLGYPFDLLEHPAVVGALPLAVGGGESKLQPVLARPRAASHGLRYRKEIEHPLVGLRSEALEPLRRRIGAPRRAGGRREE